MIYVVTLGVFGLSVIVFWFIQKWAGRGLARYESAFTAKAGKDLGEMFLFLDPRHVWSTSLFLCGVMALATYVITGSVVVTAAVAVMVLVVPPYGLRCARRRRLQNLEYQLPDLLLSLAGALRAGSGIQAALRHIADQVPAPLSQELGLMLREQRMGVSFETALSNLHRRVPTESLSLIVSALNIAAQSGGGLAENLERISTTLRMRLHLQGRIRALTSQGRMQAWVMASLPVGLALVLHWLDPEAMSALWYTPAGWAVLFLIIVLETTGIVFIRRIVHIDV